MGYPSSPAMAGSIEALLAQMVNLGDAVEAVDISSTDHTATMTNCRAISAVPADITSVVKVDFTDGSGTTKTAIVSAATGIMHIRNISKVYKTGTTADTIYLWR